MSVSRIQSRQRRHLRLRKRLHGTDSRPRMSVCLTSKHIYVQIIDDEQGRTLVAASTLDKELRANGAPVKSTVATAKTVGTLAAKRALEKKINQVVFDRGGFTYHGKIKAVADAAREAGLKF
jgi:large subunit ribosomal protein L18